MGSFIKLLRIKHWVKNLFIFVAAFFSGEFTLADLQLLFYTFFSFSLVASSIYVLNDFKDIENDRLHPKKKSRPMASGAISPKLGLSVGGLCMLLGFGLAYFLLPLNVLLIIGLYWIMNVFYSLGLKKVSILDLVFVAAGFVFRVMSGAEAVEVQLSFWLLMMTFLFSMFIVLGKRRDDFAEGDENAAQLRSVNKDYNLTFLNYGILTFSAFMLVCYVMYTFLSPYFADKIYHALLSSALVSVGLLRYLQAVFVEHKGGNPTDFAYKDRMTQGILFIWLAHFAYLIYLSA
ncbi:MAG: UbiA prenyltransferase family protein [Vicingaceae bacterium]